MKNTFGVSVTVTLFGESHGEYIGAVLDGLAPGIDVNTDFIKERLSRRRPSGGISTARREADEFKIISGTFNGKTTGTPLCIIIPNSDTKSADYAKAFGLARPSHADYTAHIKYNGFEDYRGGGHFSGRITAATVAVGAICELALAKCGIKIGTHILRCAGVSDRRFDDVSDIEALSEKKFPVLSDTSGEEMKKRILAAASELDSVGGITETAVFGLPAGVGEPLFDSIEGVLSHALFSVPAIKGVQFGAGFGFADMRGSEANDAFEYSDGKACTKTNNNGGINGGISNGMPVVFSCAVKPTPSIGKEQDTVDFIHGENAKTNTRGRHDPAIIHRACPVVSAVTAITLCDILAQKYGTDFPFRKI